MKAKKSNLKPCCVCGNEIYIPKNGKPTSCRFCHSVQRMAENGYDIIEMYTKREWEVKQCNLQKQTFGKK